MKLIKAYLADKLTDPNFRVQSSHPRDVYDAIRRALTTGTKCRGADDYYTVDEHRNLLVVANGCAYIWWQHHWLALHPAAIAGLTDAVDNAIPINGKGDIPKPVRVTTRLQDETAKMMLRDLDHTEDRFFDPPNRRRGIATLDGFWVVEEEVTRIEHSPEHRNTALWPHNLDRRHAEPLAWIKFLRDAWEGCDDVDQRIDAVQSWLGLAILGFGPAFPRALLLTGSGRNGKSVFIEVLEDLFPSAYRSSFTPSELTGTGNMFQYNRALLNKILLNAAGDLSSIKGLGCQATWKRISAGDTVTGRSIYGTPFSFRPVASHIFACNSLPRMDHDDWSEGLKRRWLVLDFPRYFSTEDSRDREELKKELREDYPDMILWALEGARRVFAERDFTLPPCHAELMRSWEEEENPVCAFFADVCELSDDGTPLTSRELHESYTNYCEENNIPAHKRLSKRKFPVAFRKLPGVRAERRTSERGRNVNHFNVVYQGKTYTYN